MTQLQTPFYRIKESALQYDIQLLKESLQKNWGNYIPGYSVKTNSLPWLLVYLKQQGFYAEVVSDTEYDLAKRLGYPDDKIIYNGPIKDRNVFETVLLNRGYVNLDSNYELTWMQELSLKYPNKQLAVGLRVNCDIKALCPQEKLAEEDGGRFGYCYENGVLKQAIDFLQALPNVSVSGLHLHSSTQSRTVDVYGALAKMAVIIAQEYNLSLDYVDMGGGYFGGRADKPDYRDYFARIGEELRTFFSPEKTALMVEPGVSLVSRATTFETTVLDCKSIGDRIYLVTDGSRVNLNPQVTRHVYPHHIEYADGVSSKAPMSKKPVSKDPVSGEPVPAVPASGKQMPQEIIPTEPGSMEIVPRDIVPRDIVPRDTIPRDIVPRDIIPRDTIPLQWVCGSTCMEYDRLFPIENGPALLPGDRIVYETAGGYTICLSPLFIHYFPAVYVEKTDGTIFTAREPWSNEEYLMKNHVEYEK